MVQLMSDPNALLTKLANPAIPTLPGSNPMVDAARQRLQASQQDLISQNYALQQQQAQQRMQRQMMARLQLLPLAKNGQAYNATPMPYTGPRNVNTWVNQALGILGLSGKYAPGILNLIQHESGGNPNAINNWDSNAKAGTPSQGLMQTIPSTFSAYALPGYNKNILDPVSNIIAGIRYALSRYGPGMLMAGGRKDQYGNYIGY